MIYYMIRHKATGEFMPQLKRDRGYSHWNPSSDKIQRKKTTGSPRLLHTIKRAKAIITQWNAMPNATQSFKQDYFGDTVDDFDIKPDSRKKEDLEIVEVDIQEVKVV